MEKTNEGQQVQFEQKNYYPEEGYYETKSKNLISKKCLIKGSDNIQIFDHVILQDKLILRADLAKINIGRYVTLCEGVIVKPPFKRQNNIVRYVPVEIGNHVFVQKNTIIQAMKVGSNVKIGKDCVIGARVVISDCVIIMDGSIIPADAYLASYCVYGGKPALYLGQLPESAGIIQKDNCVSFFNNFLKKPKN